MRQASLSEIETARFVVVVIDVLHCIKETPKR